MELHIILAIQLTITGLLIFTLKTIKKMNNAEQAAFATLTTDVTALSTGVNTLIANNKAYAAKLAEIADNTGTDQTAAIQALSEQIAAETTAVTTELSADTAPQA